MLKSEKTLAQDSILREKTLKPFWNPACQELSRQLLLPIETDLEDLHSISSNGLLKEPVENSWFSTKLSFHQNKNLLQIYYQFCMSSHADCTDLEVTKTRLVRIYPNLEQKKTLKSWTDVSRWVFNWTIDFLKSCIGFSPHWMEIKKYATRYLPEWTKAIPFQIKAIAIRDACNAFWAAKGSPKFRSRKNPTQSCFIPKTAIKSDSIYPRLLGKTLVFKEEIPENICDSRLLWRNGNWFLCACHKSKIARDARTKPEAVALDPGIRSFISFYSPNISGKVGIDTSEKMFHYFLALDNLYSRIAKTKNKKKKHSFKKAAMRLRERIRNLITELHYKTANFLCKNFDIIILPTFETKEMANKATRKIRSKSVRAMLGLSFYKFRQRLEWIALKMGCKVIITTEEYTSKTHPQTGKINHKLGGAKTIKLIDGSRADRDIVGAFNIFLKTLVGDTPA